MARRQRKVGARPEGVARAGGLAAERRRGRAGGSPIRLALAAAVLLGLIYGGLALFRIHSASSEAPAETALLQAREGAARLDTAVASLRSALTAAAVSARGFPAADPARHAETAIAGARASTPENAAVADDNVLAGVTGSARQADWAAAIRLALASGQEHLDQPRPGGGRWIYAAAVAGGAGPDGQHKALTLAAVSPKALTAGAPACRSLAIAGRRPRASAAAAGARHASAPPSFGHRQGRRRARRADRDARESRHRPVGPPPGRREAAPAP